MTYSNNGMITMYLKADKHRAQLESSLILYISDHPKQVLNTIFISMFLFALNFIFMPLKPLFDCVISLGGVYCLTKTTEKDEAWLKTFQRSISRSGLGAYDLYAHQQFLSNYWTNVKEWKEALYQYSQLKD